MVPKSQRDKMRTTLPSEDNEGMTVDKRLQEGDVRHSETQSKRLLKPRVRVIKGKRTARALIKEWFEKKIGIFEAT